MLPFGKEFINEEKIHGRDGLYKTQALNRHSSSKLQLVNEPFYRLDLSNLNLMTLKVGANTDIKCSFGQITNSITIKVVHSLE